MDRQDLADRYDEMNRQADRQYNRLFVHSRRIQHMPSFGTIPQENSDRFINGEDTASNKHYVAYTAQEQFGSVPKQRSYSNYRSSGNTITQQIFDLQTMGEMNVARRQQLETFEGLRSDIKEIKQFSGMNDIAIDRLSSIDQSSYQDSNTRSEDKPTTKEMMLGGQKKNLEVELSSKMREIQRMLMKERELQNTIHTLKMKLDCRVDEKSVEDVNRQLQKLEFTVNKLRAELKQMQVEREKLSSENMILKKQLLRKEFEWKLLLEQNSRGDDKQLVELNRRCEELNEVVNQLKDDMTRTIDDADKKLLDQKTIYESTLKEQMQQFQSKQKVIYQQFKDELVKMDRLKSNIIKQIKDNSASFDYFDTEVEYETIYGGLIAKLEHLYTGKGDLSNGYSEYTSSRRQSDLVPADKNTLLEELRSKNQELSLQIRRLNNFIEDYNQVKKRLLSDIEESKSTHQTILRQRDNLRREVNDLRRTNDQYQKINEKNSFLQGEIRTLNEKNEQILRGQKTKSDQMYSRSSIDEQEYIRLKQRYEELLINKGTLEEQHFKLQHNIGEGRATIQSLEVENTSLKRKWQEKNDYIVQIEEALMPIQPKLPGILKKREFISDELATLQLQNHNLKARVAELEQMIEQRYAAYTESLRKDNNVSELQQTIRHLSDEVERLQEQCNRLKTENSDICRSRERMSSQYQKEVNNLVASHTDNERIAHAQFEEELRNVREEILKSQAERLEYIEVIKDLSKQNSKKDDELRMREAQHRTKQLNLQKEITRITSENAIIKKNSDLQIEMLSCSNSEASRRLIQKYQRDIQQLHLTIQGLQNESKQVHSLQQQLTQLNLINRELSIKFKERSVAVDHLWEIKQVEFSNIMTQLNIIRSIPHQ